MSPYEQNAWDSTLRSLNRRRNSKARKAVGVVTTPVKKAAKAAWHKFPVHEDVEQQVMKALSGMKAVTFDPALRSVDAAKALKRHGVSTRAELLKLDLQQLDCSLPGFRTFYSALAMVEGGGSALVVTGAEVSSTVGGGVTVGVAVAAIGVDAATSMALMGRVIGRVAAEYGYDVRLPEEEAFALGVMSLGSAATAAEKAAALANLRRLTTLMMRQPTWEALHKHALVKLIDQVFTALGEKLVKRKLAQAVPVAGVLINAGLSAQMADIAYRSARDAYRLRFLSEKYGVDPVEWVADQPDSDDPMGSALDEMTSLDTADASVVVVEPDKDGLGNRE
ncbi:MAG: EcsC family protein [Actinomycetota bacterium]|nr:EcsC family protein [Actinomycetota bacterium]